jgi:hypothetical protein
MTNKARDKQTSKQRKAARVLKAVMRLTDVSRHDHFRQLIHA